MHCPLVILVTGPKSYVIHCICFENLLTKVRDNTVENILENETYTGASLAVQWLRIHLQFKGHQFDPWENPTCHGATKPVHHKY